MYIPAYCSPQYSSSNIYSHQVYFGMEYTFSGHFYRTQEELQKELYFSPYLCRLPSYTPSSILGVESTPSRQSFTHIPYRFSHSL